MSDNTNDNTPSEALDENQLVAERRRKLNELRDKSKSEGKSAFPNQFRRNASAEEMHALYENRDKPTLEETALVSNPVSVVIGFTPLLTTNLRQSALSTSGSI